MQILKRIFRFLDLFRRLCLGALFYGFILLGAALFLMTSDPKPTVPSNAVLVVDLAGTISENGRRRLDFLGAGGGFMRGMDKQTRLLDVLDAFARAEADTDVSAVILDVSGLESLGLAAAQSIGEAVERFKKVSGRPVYAWSISYTQAQYAIAAHADVVGMHPMGSVELKGLSGSAVYFGGLLKKFGIDPGVYKAGAFKSAPEVFVRGSASSESLESQKAYMDPAWASLVKDIEAARGLPEGSIRTYFETLSSELQKGGTLAGIQLEKGFVDVLESEAAFERRVVEALKAKGGEAAERSEAPEQIEKAFLRRKIEFCDYLDARDERTADRPGVALVIAEGAIASGGSAGISAEELIERLDDAQKDRNAKAIVLRLNTPGGDAVASELIREKLLAIRAKGIPVVVSMGDAAASGGYWAASGADKIVANPQTLTGSIGVFALQPNAAEFLRQWSVGVSGYATAPLADSRTGLTTPTILEKEILQSEVNRTYQRFKAIVAEARKMDAERVEEIAQGRVWLGAQAAEIGLVDRLGGQDEAEKLAKELAKLPPDAPCILFDEKASALDEFLMEMGACAAQFLGRLNVLAELFSRAAELPEALTVKSGALYALELNALKL